MRRNLLAALIVFCGAGAIVAGCAPHSPVSSARPDEDPVAFAREFYRSVLTGDPDACKAFTSAGLRDFLSDMRPAATCPEAVDVLGNAVGEEHVSEFVAGHSYSLASAEGRSAVVRIDFGTTADLMVLTFVDGGWKVGPTKPEQAPVGE